MRKTFLALTAAACLVGAATLPAVSGSCNSSKTKVAKASYTHAPDIVKTASEAGMFETLLAAVDAAGLKTTLMGDGPFTVLAPTDEAFAKIDKHTLNDLLKPENRDTLVNILTYHVVPGRVLAKDAVGAERAATVQGSKVEFQIADGRLQVNDVNVIATDIESSNGVIHVIDTVLMPN